MNDEPVIKKMKYNNLSANFQVLINYMERIQTSTRNLQAILNDELFEPLPQVQVYAGCIKNRKDTSRALQVLNEKLPLLNLHHLKRVYNNFILLCPLSQIDNVAIQKYVDDEIPELRDIFESFQVVPVPKHMPMLKRQYTKENMTWSCNFHPDAYLEKLASNNFFSNADLEMHRFHMLIAFDSLVWFFQMNGFTDVTEEIFRQYNVTVIVDPDIRSVVTVAIDNRLKHPVQHSVMVAIDNVAKTQNGGAWGNKTFSLDSAEIVLNAIDEDLIAYLEKRYVKVKFGAKQYKSKEENLNVEGPYLCTNYYVYTIREPCLMCSMALVHARAKRIFFCLDNPEFGAIKSKTKLHSVSSLNHHYEVFTGFL